MIPIYNEITGELTYRLEKYIDLDKVMKILRDMDYASTQFLKKFDKEMEFMFNGLCKANIKESMELIREGVQIAFDFIYAMNNSIIE